MSGPNNPGRFRSGSGWSLAIALCAAGSALAAPSPIVQTESPTPVATVTAEQLDRLSASRDLLAILNYHNQLRAEVGAPPLRWNPDLAAGAAAYGPALSQGGTIRHASREGRKTVRENLSQSPRGSLSPLSMVQRWGNEKRNFRPGKFPDVTTDGNVDGILHYSQMIWPTTTDLGCAIHSDRSFDWLICRYSPPGNKDGVAMGPTRTRLADTQPGGLCTSPRGVTIPCQNAPGGGVQEDGGGTVDDGGGDIDTGIKEEVACAVDVNVHKPISLADDEEVIPQDDEFAKGATTLRNDDSDWRLGGDGGTGLLPIITLGTDLDRPANPRENDLVKVQAINPGLTDVYLFAFPTHAEADRNLKTKVDQVPGGRHASGQELAYFNAATKGPPAAGLPLLIPPGPPTILWVEAKLGGRYRMVIGKLIVAGSAADVRYDAVAGTAYIKETRAQAFVCDDQATVTAAVVDIFQRNRNDVSERRTAFDVYWGGRPHFRAKVWPGGNAFTWGAPFKLGAQVGQMPGTAVDGFVALTDKDEEDAPNDRGATIKGTEVKPTGTADGDFSAKGTIQGGFQIHTVPGAAPGDVPNVNRAVGNRYPERVSLGYMVNKQPLVRQEYLEVILPQVQQPAAARETGSPTAVSNKVQYTIVDAFNRRIKAASVADYIHLYGASLKAWEALMLGQPTPNLVERDRKNDFLELINVGVTAQGRPLDPIRFGTAQRSQAEVSADRMTHARFTDTLALDLVEAGYDTNHQKYLWQAWTGLFRQTPAAQFDPAATRLAENGRRDEARTRAEDIRKGKNVDDRARIAGRPVLAIPQDIILQLRVGTTRHDVMVLGGNAITLFPPYFFAEPGFPGYNPRPPAGQTNNVFSYHMDFAPGAQASQLVGPNHQRPP